jgi:hypothetical protein
MEYFGMNEDSKALTKTGYKEDEPSEGEQEMPELSVQEQTMYRALAARVNYMAQDDPSIQYAAKEICRHMSKPKAFDFQRIKKLARFLVGVQNVSFKYVWQSEDEGRELRVFVDSDWAGCIQSRRSTSGGMLRLGHHVLRAWSSTQPTVALSSAEAEFYAMVEGATRGIGFKTMLGELGVTSGAVELYTDSSAAKSFASRRGLGKLRHICIKDLWLQEEVKVGRIRLQKVQGEYNPADLLTKYLDISRICSLCRLVDVHVGVKPRGSVEHTHRF